MSQRATFRRTNRKILVMDGYENRGVKLVDLLKVEADFLADISREQIFHAAEFQWKHCKLARVVSVCGEIQSQSAVRRKACHGSTKSPACLCVSITLPASS